MKKRGGWKLGPETEEHKKKIALTKIGKKRKPEHIAKWVATRKANGGYDRAWNSGLTKETNSIVKRYSDSRLGKNNPIFHNPNWSEQMRQNGLKAWINGHPTARIHNTDIEIIMQKELDKLQIKYLTHQVVNKRWVVDILLVDYPIVIECDGDYWHSSPEAVKRDSIKNLDLCNLGFKVMRFRGRQIKHSLNECSKLIEDIVRTAGQLAESSRNVVTTTVI